MQPSDAPVLLYLWDKRTFYLSAFAEPLQLSQAAAMLLVGLDDELLIHSQGAALRCRSVLLPPGLELLVDSRGSRVALCYLDVFGEDFALLAPRMAVREAGLLHGLDEQALWISRFDALHRSSADPEAIWDWLERLINPHGRPPALGERTVCHPGSAPGAGWRRPRRRPDATFAASSSGRR